MPGREQDPVDEELTFAQDAVRLAADASEAVIAARLAEAAGRGREGLETTVRAWRYGATAALSVLEDEWVPEAESLARARAALESAWHDDDRPRLRAARNRWTVLGTSTQLRLSRDGRWWPYLKEHGRWVPAGPAAHDPATALASVNDEDITPRGIRV